MTRRRSHRISHLLLPVLVAERHPVLHCTTERVQFRLSLRHVDVINPLRRPCDGPFGEPPRSFVACAQARPLPVLGSAHQGRAKRIPLDVPAHPQEMGIATNWNRFEPSL